MIPAHTTCNAMLCLTDLMATSAALLEVKLPAGSATDSESFFGHLKEQSPGERGHVVHHAVSGMFALRLGKWKYIEGQGDGMHPTNWKALQESGRDKPCFDPSIASWIPFRYNWPDDPLIPGSPGQLYDLEADPIEKQNLYDSFPEKAEEMQLLLRKIRDGDIKAHGRMMPAPIGNIWTERT